jgi:hypothetical protein
MVIRSRDLAIDDRGKTAFIGGWPREQMSNFGFASSIKKQDGNRRKTGTKTGKNPVPYLLIG